MAMTKWDWMEGRQTIGGSTPGEPRYMYLVAGKFHCSLMSLNHVPSIFLLCLVTGKANSIVQCGKWVWIRLSADQNH